jgi:phosphomannomutase/phosphoglucomutase
VLLINLPLDFLRKSLEGFSKKEGGKIKLVQKLGEKGEDTTIVNLNADSLSSPPLTVNNHNWYLQIEAPTSQGKILLIIAVLGLTGIGVVVAMLRLIKRFDHTLNQDMTAIQSMLKGETPSTPLNFALTSDLQGTLVTHKVVVANQQKRETEVDTLAGIEMSEVDIAALAAKKEAKFVADAKDLVAIDETQTLDLEVEPEKEEGLNIEMLEFSNVKAKDKENSLIPAHVFRAYDIRGKAHTEISTALAHQIGLAIGTEAQIRGENTVVVGKDARLSSDELCQALVEGLRESGCDVINVGQVPTPVLYFAAKNLGTGSGVMVTASHNPAPDNGFKVMLANHTLVDTEIYALRQRILDKDFKAGAGAYIEREISEDYLQQLNDDVILARNFNVVVDAGNGVAGPLAVKMLEALGCTVSALYCNPDGNFPNHDPDPTKAENLEDLLSDVAISGADVGIALDGDGDRVVIVTNSTKIIASDKLLMLFAKELLATQPGADILFDVKCSRDLVTVITTNGGRPIMTKSGHSWLKAGMEETGAPLAGEMSGHFFFKDRWGGFDDGLYAAARFLEILANSYGSTADDLFAGFPERFSTPEIIIPVAEDLKQPLIARLIANSKDIPNAVVNTIDGLRVEFPSGWGIVRASNTGSHLVARFEANDEASLEQVKEFFRDLLQLADPMLLPSF